MIIFIVIIIDFIENTRKKKEWSIEISLEWHVKILLKELKSKSLDYHSWAICSRVLSLCLIYLFSFLLFFLSLHFDTMTLLRIYVVTTQAPAITITTTTRTAGKKREKLFISNENIRHNLKYFKHQQQIIKRRRKKKMTDTK